MMCFKYWFLYHSQGNKYKNCSLLYVETADRPGLLVDLVKTITDINVAVQSGEFDTEVTCRNS